MSWHSFWDALTRKKLIEVSDETKLARVLNLFDLTTLGVGSTLGLGVYILAGSVAHSQAGPAVIISFLIAAVASGFASFCYAEFAARVPKAGSAYVYSYVTVGEFIAFTIGWNLILEYVIGVSSVARGLSVYIDALFDYRMRKFWRELMPIDVDFLADYPDLLSFMIVMSLTLVLAYGVKESSWIHSFFTTINLMTITIVLVAGSLVADPKNWFKTENNSSNGSFAPFGFSGIISGAATCFYGFIGFDCVATAGEEAKNAKRTIPLAIILTCFICVLVYMAISIVLTMMMPYYELNPEAPFISAFHGSNFVYWTISIGSIFALFSALLGALFSLPRVIYAMSSDGVLFKSLSKVNERTKTPLKATIFAGFLSALLAAFFSLKQLVDVLSIGTLLAYSIVALSVIVLRYDGNSQNSEDFYKNLIKFKTSSEKPSKNSSILVKISSTIFMILSLILGSLVTFFELNFYLIFSTLIVSFLMILCLILIQIQPTDKTKKLSFKVPLVPLVPCLSILINIYLMLQLDFHTWIRFGVWMIVGYLIYFLYGIRKSNLQSKV